MMLAFDPPITGYTSGKVAVLGSPHHLHSTISHIDANYKLGTSDILSI